MKKRRAEKEKTKKNGLSNEISSMLLKYREEDVSIVPNGSEEEVVF